MANSTFFSSKYGDLEPQKNSFGLVAPFLFGGGGGGFANWLKFAKNPYSLKTIYINLAIFTSFFFSLPGIKGLQNNFIFDF
jgi:hypothetical protein